QVIAFRVPQKLEQLAYLRVLRSQMNIGNPDSPIVRWLFHRNPPSVNNLWITTENVNNSSLVTFPTHCRHTFVTNATRRASISAPLVIVSSRWVVVGRRDIIIVVVEINRDVADVTVNETDHAPGIFDAVHAVMAWRRRLRVVPGKRPEGGKLFDDHRSGR